MGTSNFYIQDASQAFVMNPDKFEDNRDIVSQCFSDSPHEEYSYYEDYDGRVPNALRSFPSQMIGTMELTGSLNSVEYEVSADIFLTCGYYSSANVDYCLDHIILDEDFEDDKLVLEKINLEKVRLSEYIEKRLSEVTDCYIVAGHLSNGETFYEATSN